MNMLETTLVAARDRKRLAEIAAAAARLGLDDVAGRLGLARLGLVRDSGPGESGGMSQPERVRRALEQLGPTFVKLGQILSTRADLLGPEWIAELEKLQSAVAPAPWETIAAQLETDLGAPPDAVFAAFDPEPLAAGSIAQVHRARLKDGSAVVVKIRRAGLRGQVEADLRLLTHVAGLVEKDWKEAARYRPREILQHLGAAMGEELDLAAEGRNSEVIAANLAGRDDIHIPAVHWEWSCERLLVQDYVEGIAPGDAAALEAAGLDGAILARRGTGAFLQMALVDGFFHADPHPGNLRALPGNRVAFIDFGMVGRIGARRREQLLRLIGAITRGDSGGVAAVMLGWADGDDPEIGRLEAECDAFIARHGGGPLQLGPALTDFMALARNARLAMPADLALLFKALITADGVMRRLDPDFDVIAVAEPLVRARMRARLSPAALRDRGQALGAELYDLAGEAPGLMRLLAHRLRQGRIKADIDLGGLDLLGGDIRWAARRLAAAIVIGAFAIGLAPFVLSAGPVLFGVPAGALAGLAVIAAGAVWLAWPRRR